MMCEQRMVPLLALGALAAVMLFSARVDAQDDGALEEARHRFRVAAIALEEGRPADACEDFEAVRETIDSAAVRWNLALCSRALGRYAAALTHLRVFLGLTTSDDVSEERRATARVMRDAVSARLARLILSAPRHAVVRVDGVERQDTAEPIVLDPGRHRVEVAADGFTNFDHTFEASSGESVRLIAVLTPSAPERLETGAPDDALDAATSAPVEQRASSVPVTQRWWFWTAVTVVVAGAAVGTGIAVARGNDSLPGVHIETLR